MSLLRKFLCRFVQVGSLEVAPFQGAAYVVGDGGPPTAGFRLIDAAAEWELLRNPEMALGELYADGRLELTRGDLVDLLALGSKNIGGSGEPHLRIAWRALRALRQRLAPLGSGRARANAAHHYDLDRRFYRLFLDDDLQYSCAYFERPSASLDEAQLAKKRHIAAKLALAPGARTLDIGCGWGGLALYLAARCGAEVLGVTLSREQLGVARQRAEAAELASKVSFAYRDYREIEGRFDRIVSVGMFEHVGPRHYDAFFRQIAALLAEDGAALIHTIGHCGAPAPTSPWIRKYVFPDGYIPALAEIAPAIARAGLVVDDLEVLREHYALTLDHWRARFAARRAEAKAIYGERFCRIWEYYLAASLCAFRHQGCVVFQLQLTRRADVLPITRDYIAAREADLASQH
ncbi:MAG TPA: cyclopropane-fatty-acyl-phospholipid synthase family protein [Rhodoblastus sp.]|nr:cyclopropane-fatty-acyl-phospholipid synthase family protein [Rhodoblastus sp.]